jgi:tetratricopeptide (TPR) repeat protein
MSFAVLALLAFGLFWASAMILGARRTVERDPPEDARAEHLRAFEAVLAAGEHALQSGNADQARELAERALGRAERTLEADAPETARAWLLLGTALTYDERYEAAIACFERARDAALRNERFTGIACRAFEELALACTYLGRDAEAARALDEAERHGAGEPERLYETLAMRGRVAVLRGELDAAEDCFGAALRASGEGGHESPYRGRTAGAARSSAGWRLHVELAAVAYRRGRVRDAERVLREALASIEGDEAAELSAIAYHLEAEGLLPAALPIARAVGSFEGHLHAARIAHRLGRCDEAQDLLDEAEAMPDANAVKLLLRRAELDYLELAFEGGEALVAEAIALDEDWHHHLDATTQLARSAARWAAQGNVDAREVEWLALEPFGAASLAFFATMRGLTSLAERASASARRLAERPSALRAVARVDALRFAIVGAFDDAFAELDSVDRVRLPAFERGAMLQDRGWIELQRGDFATAAQRFEAAANTYPPSGDPGVLTTVWAGCAAAYAQAGELTRAQEALERAQAFADDVAREELEHAYA